MTEVENIVLEQLRHIHGAVDALREDVRELKVRRGGVERIENHLQLSEV